MLTSVWKEAKTYSFTRGEVAQKEISNVGKLFDAQSHVRRLVRSKADVDRTRLNLKILAL